MRRGLLKEYSTTLDISARLLDPFVVFITAYVMGKGGWFYPFDLARVIAFYSAPLVFLIFPFFKIYRSWRFSSLFMEVVTVILALGTVLILFNLFIIILADAEKRKVLVPFCLFRHPPYLLWAGIVSLALVSLRITLRVILRSLRKRGYNLRNALIIGVSPPGEQLAKFFDSKRWMGVKVKGFLDDSVKTGQKIEDYPVLGGISQLKEHLDGLDWVFITLPFKALYETGDLLSVLADSTASVYFVPDIFAFELLFNTNLSDIGGVPVLALRTSPLEGANRYVKRLMDLVIGTIILILFLPAMVLIAFGIKISSPGPVIFKQRRCGISGDEFMVYKFGTMAVCEDGENLEQAKKCDPRVTRFGAFLRKTSLDELPQLFNVLLGNMSLVGPRPHALAHNEEFRRLVQGYMLRHKVKPGVTGLAQVKGFRGETDTLDKLEKRVEYDLKYLNSWSIWLDLKILFLTSLQFFRQPTAY